MSEEKKPVDSRDSGLDSLPAGPKDSGLLRSRQVNSTDPGLVDDRPPVVEQPLNLPLRQAGVKPLNDLNDTMEVHKHPHHVTHKKKWGEYFLEFLMLFLAVFLGFIAENQREVIVEKKREKQFISSLLNDLQLDVAWLDTVTNSARSRMINLDSAILMLAANEKDEITPDVYRQLRRSTIQIMFFPNDGTITQLKSAGGLRLIENRKVVDSIENYDRLIRRLEVRRDITNGLNHDLMEGLNRSFVAKDLLKTNYNGQFYQKETSVQRSIRLNSQYVNELINQSISLRLRAVSDTTANNVTKTAALGLIRFIKSKYHLE